MAVMKSSMQSHSYSESRGTAQYLDYARSRGWLESPRNYRDILQSTGMPEDVLLLCDGYSHGVDQLVRKVNGRLENYSEVERELLKKFGRNAVSLDVQGFVLKADDLRLIAHCFPNIEELNLSKCSLIDEALHELRHFKKLFSVKLCWNTELTDLGALKNCSSLRELDISDCRSAALTCIDELTQLTHLHMDNVCYESRQNQVRIETLESNGMIITGKWPRGLDGPAGRMGRSGLNGERGHPGEPGERGLHGPRGFPGPIGKVGARGAAYSVDLSRLRAYQTPVKV